MTARPPLRLVIALIPPIVAMVVLMAGWSFFQPGLWFIFYPAVFLSSWLGGLAGAVAGSAIGVLSALWLLPPSHSFLAPPGGYVESAVFFATGVTFGLFHDRMRRTTARAQSLAEEREVFAALVENSSDFIGIADPSGRPIYVNPAGRRMVGLEPDRRLDDADIPAYYAEDQRRFASEVILKEVSEKGHWEGETAFRHWRTQAAIPVSDTHFLIRDPASRALIGMGTVTRDITERKRAEDALRRAEAKASGILSIAADAIISVDEHQRITLFNEGAEKIFGYSRAEAIGAPLSMLMPERFRSHHAELVERYATDDALAARMATNHRDVVGLRKNGEEFPAEATLSKLGLDGERILTVALRDVTDRKRLEGEQALLAEMGSVLTRTLELPQILSSIAQLTTRALADACIVYVGGEHRDLHPAQAAIRDPSKAGLCDALARVAIDELVARERLADLAESRPVVIEHVAGDEPLATIARRRGDVQVLRELDARSMMIAPLFARRRIVGALALISTEDRRGFGRGDVQFVEQVAQRAALAIDNAGLYADACRAIQIRDDVVGIVAHDLRNPLGSILLQAGLLRTVPELRSQKSADSIERSATRMSRLIDDLLDVTRIEEGRLSVEPVRVAAAPVVAQVIDANASAASGKQLRADLEPGLPDVLADRDRLLQILENLVGNAVKFTGAGGLVMVGATRRDGDVVFSVADSGVGIAADDLPHVFDRFWQAQRGRRSGAGLGLAIAKGLVEAHGGRIWIESEPGHGTTVFFTIPAAAAAEPHAALSPSSTSA